MDNRPEGTGTVQRKLQEMANNSSQVQRANQLHAIVNNKVGFSCQLKSGVTDAMQINGKELVKVSQFTKVIQRAPWLNVNAMFKSDNGMPDIANSEYLVAAESYQRYAPINKIRAPGQIFHEDPRSFAYVDSSDKGHEALSSTVTALPVVDDSQRKANYQQRSIHE